MHVFTHARIRTHTHTHTHRGGTRKFDKLPNMEADMITQDRKTQACMHRHMHHKHHSRYPQTNYRLTKHYYSNISMAGNNIQGRSLDGCSSVQFFKMVSMRSGRPICDHMCSTPSLRRFPNVAIETVPKDRPILLTHSV